MTTLNELCNDPAWIQKLEDKDELATNRKAHFLPGKALNANVSCKATVCKWETRFAAGKTAKELSSTLGEVETLPRFHPMLLCFGCNRTYHVLCVDLSLKTWHTESLPWRCPGCQVDPINPYAKIYYESKEWEKGMKSRRTKLLSKKALSENPKLLEVHSDDEDYDKDDEDSFADPNLTLFVSAAEFEEQQKTITTVAAEMEKVVAEKQKLEEKLRELELQKKREAEKQDKVNVTQPSFRTSASSTLSDSRKVLTAKDILTQVYVNASRKTKKENTFNVYDSSSRPGVGAGFTRPTSGAGSSSFSDDAGARPTEPAHPDMSDIDVSKLNDSEKIIWESMHAQKVSAAAQKEVSSAMVLEQRRKALQKIGTFSGDVRDWIRFKRDVTRHQEIGQFDEASMKLLIIKALDGVAADRVRDFIEETPLEYTMKVLEKSFGKPSRIISKRGEDIMALKIGKELFADDITIVLTKIQSYFAACSYANVEVADTNSLAKHIFEQLPSENRQKCREFHRTANADDPHKLLDLQSLFQYLENIVEDLDDRKPKATQVNVTSVTQSSNQTTQRSDNRGYVIKDISEAKFMGYNMNQLKSFDKKCLLCSKAHYTVECRDYKAMDKEKRHKFIMDNGLCRNCVIATSHRAPDCTLKQSCGMLVNNNHCTGKHHVSVHGVSFRPNGNQNSNRRFNNYNNGNRRQANQQPNSNSNESDSRQSQNSWVDSALKDAPTLNQLSHNNQSRVQAAAKPNGNIVTASIQHNSMSQGTQGKTIKVFKTEFIGRTGNVIGHSVGDSAAEATLVTESLRSELGIKGERHAISLRFADSSVKNIVAQKVDLTIRGVHKNAKTLVLRNCYAIADEDFNLPPRSLDMKLLRKQFPYLRQVKCESYTDVSPQLLIGSTHASVVESCGRLYEDVETNGNPIGLLAKLGWCVYGGDLDVDSENGVANVQIQSDESPETTAMTNEELFDAFSFFNSVENLNLKELPNRHTEDEAKALEIMEEEMTILPDGTIEVPLVWNRDERKIPQLPDNLPMVLKRQYSHEAKLLKSPELHQIFNEKFKELIAERYVRPATQEDLNRAWQNVNYLPMTLVINHNKVPVGYRIVFDAAAKYKNTSLNMNLLKGPDLLVNLHEPLLRMRTKQVAINADIKAMFMRMKVNMRDQQCQRVLFREHPNEEMRIFVVSSVLFGPTCSPFQSQYCKNLIAQTWQDYYPDAADAIRNYMYMDDLLTSEATTDKALQVATRCIEMFAAVNWHLVSFQSNEVDFLKRLPEGSVKQQTIPLMEDASQLCTAKVLGCMWDTRNDNFIFNFDKNLFIKIVKDCEHKPTKRDQSSTIARIFDAMGFLSHLVIRGRILLQESWADGLDWDQTISEAQHKRWLEWLHEIENAAKVKIPRKLCVGRDLWECEDVELHIFSDAGAEAYAAVAYLVTAHKGKRSSSIVMARAKVTPLRYKSKTRVTEIPRLELFAALSAARLAHVLTNSFPGLEMKRYMWSDSEIVLKWIKNSNMHLKAYAVSPIDEILCKTDKTEWSYVPSKLNAADIATKFKKFDFSDSESMWFKGPDFIVSDKNLWPKQNETQPKLNDSQQEEDTSMTIANVSIDTDGFKSPIKLPDVDDVIANDFYISSLPVSVRSTWIKMVRATARGLKIYMDGFIPLVMSKKYNDPKTIAEIKAKNFNILTPYDYDRAELFLVRRVQRRAFKEEYAALREGKPINDKEMLQLQVFLDDQGVMRINSRVKLCQNVYPQRFAPLLPRGGEKGNPFTQIFLFHVHYEYKHIHLESQIAAARAKYWIPNVRVALKSIQHKCHFCLHLRARPYRPLMAPLPSCRTDPSQNPFQTTGLDCAGPITVYIHGRPKKIWILIFSCTLTRFIQLHILESLESIKVMEAIAVLWASNGPVQTFLSDRGTNFIGANRFIREEYERTKCKLQELRDNLAQTLAEKYRVDWKFFPAHSPWMGGFYERQIKEVKRSIAVTLENKKLTKVELNIALQDACHRINCRPLTHNPLSAEDEEVLTPHHLARGRPGYPYLPSITIANLLDPTKDRDLFRRGRYIADAIMKRYVTGYLPVLTKRTKWFLDKTTPLRIGDLVMLIEPGMTRREWRRGRVLKLYKSGDRKARVADVQLPDGVVKIARSVQRLAKLEIVPRNEVA